MSMPQLAPMEIGREGSWQVPLWGAASLAPQLGLLPAAGSSARITRDPRLGGTSAAAPQLGSGAAGLY